MQAVELVRFGSPADAVALVEVPDLGPPEAGIAIVDVLAAPINPADLALMAGAYGATPPALPCPVGAEGVGVVRAVGPDVRHIAPGDRVLLLGARSSWREQVACSAALLFPLPQEADVLQLAMLTVNPPTALRMLSDMVPLHAGDWVVQNAANSGVGLSVIALAPTLGLRTVNIVRRQSLVAELTALGADVVLLDGDDLPQRVAEATGGGPVPLGLDAVGGVATKLMAASLSDGGTVVNYGLLSGDSCRVAVRETIFRDVRLVGFWLARWYRTAPPEVIRATFKQLVELVTKGTIHVPVAATYPLSRVHEAVAHAAQEGRDGKVLLRPDTR